MEQTTRLRRIESDAYRLRIEIAGLAANVAPLSDEVALHLDEFQVAADAVAEAFPQVVEGSLPEDEARTLELAWEAMVAAADEVRAAARHR